MNRSMFLCVVVAAVLSVAALAPAEPRYISFMIPMRDGKALAADLYSIDTSVARPLIVIQTPYDKFFYRHNLSDPQSGGTVLPFDSTHYNYLTVDWRGFYASVAAAVPGYDRGLDGYDIIEWSAAQRWCNGKVGTWGVSALGLIQFETMKHRPPHHVCAMPMMKDYVTKYSNYYPGGVYNKEHTESLQRLGFLSTATILAHPTQDLYWTLAEAVTDYPESVAVPVLMVGGWFDYFPDDVLRAFGDLRARSAPAVRGLHKMIMGPWLHAKIEDTTQGALTFPGAVGVASAVAQEFFDYYLRGIANGYSSRPTLRYYQMGDEQWKEAPSWDGISTQADTLFFGWGSSGVLSPTRVEPGDIVGVAFLYDPRSSSPAIGGPRFNPFDPSIPVGPQDQRSLVESRSDVLCFTTGALASGLEILGPVRVVLNVHTNRTDTDFSVRLCDVYPDGRSMLMTQGIRRMRFRDSYSSPSLVSPMSTVQLVIDVGNLALTVLPGHALRLDVSSTVYPQYDLNLNNGGPMYVAGDTLIATNVVDFNSYALIPTGAPVSVPGERKDVPVASALLQNYPNPFNASTFIGFTVAGEKTGSGATSIDNSLLTIDNRLGSGGSGLGSGWVRLSVYDLLGREVAVLVNGRREPGEYEVKFDGSGLSSGVYFYRLEVRPSDAAVGRDSKSGTGDFVATKPLLLLR